MGEMLRKHELVHKSTIKIFALEWLRNSCRNMCMPLPFHVTRGQPNMGQGMFIYVYSSDNSLIFLDNYLIVRT
ncbi:unnamed protein product [Spirodela intermedia]|uniref:Uncharacterized protein n=1 Tax=Spirodela intermedia TaxID=51605 RepID=A0A7I8LI62_SPIIN|nr:unnamed protein product [Spirodela intermedia]